MWFKFIYLLTVLNLGLCRVSFVPKFFDEDSAISVNTVNSTPLPIEVKNSSNLLSYYHAVQPYPMYEIVPAMSQFPSTTVLPGNIVNPDEFPKDLLDIAKNKLGLKSMDEVPTISALGELLGTKSPTETIKQIRQLTSTEKGIAFLKAYLESADYTDNARTAVENDENETDSVYGKDTSNDIKLVPVTDPIKKITPKPQLGFLERMSKYFSNLLPHHDTVHVAPTTQIKPPITQIKPPVTQTKPLPQIITRFATQYRNLPLPVVVGNFSKKPMLIRNPLPYHYPIPMRPQTVSVVENVNSSKIATPKALLPHIQQLARVTKIPQKKLETFLQSKPKLAELATRVSTFSLAHDRDTKIDAQLIAAVEKAIGQDEDLKKLLNSAKTLK
ncbi:uncharacterized protein LOC119680796 [Teleopsis dalmanni]|uniref:uncharacterized protein LOC119680796 n=1 Tax=Teleopsis dalmanni TaxID=139649 RepID=UPI0018CF3A68|nr:uncharacterized protein LOC119680796 [Teleopsis dalmanni]